jgi:ubiquinone/menaquinone biosynthesis C-methylase UbiE
MGFYSRVVFPRFCDWAMSDARFSALRTAALKDVEGQVLEIGFGSGLNLQHYPIGVRQITAVDPGQGMNRLARKRMEQSPIAVDVRIQSAEGLPFGGESFDWVVSTWTLCSIRKPEQALAEIYRVLRPEGKFVFLEHGLSDDPRVQRWQRRLSPLQQVIGDGCRLDVDVEAVTRGQPFQSVTLERFLFEKTPKTHGSMYRGVAIK